MDKYLLEILKEVNTIIIPGLGALTITNPDTGEIMFMSYLKHDDGKLAAYIVNKEGIDENEAKNQIAKYVRQIQAELDKGESYDMFEFGSFYKENDEIAFRNWERSGSKVTSAPKAVDKPVVKKEEKKEGKTEAKTAVPAKEIEKPSKEIGKKGENSSTSSAKEAPKNASTSSATGVQKEVSEKKKSETDKVVEDKTTKKVSEVKEAPKKIVPEVKATEKTAKSPIKEEEKKKEVPVSPIPPSKDKKEPNILQKEEKAATAAKMNKLKEKKKEKENSEKKKRGVGFWMLIGLIVIIIAGGTFVGLNYEMVKQHIPFLADNSAKKEKVKKKSPKDKMIEILDKGEKEDEEIENEMTEHNSEDQLPINDVNESTVEENVIETKPVVTQNNSSTDLPFRIIAGAFSSEDNAHRLADRYQEKGYATNVSFGRGMFLVSIKSYSSRSEAQNGLNEVMADAPKAWIYEAR